VLVKYQPQICNTGVFLICKLSFGRNGCRLAYYFVRGAQQPGEYAHAVVRLHGFQSRDEVESRIANRLHSKNGLAPMFAQLPEKPGKREQLYQGMLFVLSLNEQRQRGLKPLPSFQYWR